MTSTHVRVLAVLALAVTTVVSSAHAQGRPGAQARGRVGTAERPLAPLEVLDMLDAYALVQAQRALELNDKQYGEFVTRLRRLQQVRRGHTQARNRLVNELRQLTRADLQQVDESAIRDRLRQLRDHDERADDELRKAHDALDEVLDLRQQARFRIFEETLERRKLDLLMRARRGAAGSERQ